MFIFLHLTGTALPQAQLALIKGFGRFLGWKQSFDAAGVAPTPLAFIELEQVDTAYSFEDYAAITMGDSAFASLIAALFDLRMGVSASQMPAAFVLANTFHFLPAWIRYSLRKLGVTSDNIEALDPHAVPSELKALIADSSSYVSLVPTAGMQQVFTAIVQDIGVTVHNSSYVNSVYFDTSSEKWVIKTDNDLKTFDYVFIDTPPADAVLFLPHDLELYQLLSKAKSGAVRAAIMEASPPLPATMPTTGTFILEKCANKLATGQPWDLATELPTCPVMLSKPYADINYFMVYAFLNPSSPFAEQEANFISQANFTLLTTYGFTVGDISTSLRATRNYPSYVSVEDAAAGWYANMSNIQGANGLFYIGDIVSGGNLPALHAFSVSLLKQYFTITVPSSSPDETWKIIVGVVVPVVVIAIIVAVLYYVLVVRKKPHDAEAGPAAVANRALLRAPSIHGLRIPSGPTTGEDGAADDNSENSDDGSSDSEEEEEKDTETGDGPPTTLSSDIFFALVPPSKKGGAKGAGLNSSGEARISDDASTDFVPIAHRVRSTSSGRAGEPSVTDRSGTPTASHPAESPTGYRDGGTGAGSTSPLELATFVRMPSGGSVTGGTGDEMEQEYTGAPSGDKPYRFWL